MRRSQGNDGGGIYVSTTICMVVQYDRYCTRDRRVGIAHDSYAVVWSEWGNWGSRTPMATILSDVLVRAMKHSEKVMEFE